MPHDHFVPLIAPERVMSKLAADVMAGPRLATVDPIRDNNAAWGAKACAGDALSRCLDGDVMICIWITKDGEIKWSAANVDHRTAPVIAMKMTMMAQGTMGNS